MVKRVIVLLFTLVILPSGGLSCATARGPTPTPTLTPLPLQASGWEAVTVHTLCLEVKQSYPEIEELFSQPIAEVAERILAGLGLPVAAEGASCDAHLTFVLTLRALGANYHGDISGYCYTGAEASGQVTLAVPGREPLTLPASGTRPSPYGTVSCPREPVDAPFEHAWAEALLDGLGNLWGPQALIQSLGDEDWFVGSAATRVLARIGPETVPLLIQALGHEDAQLRENAAQALRKIGPEARQAVPALIQALEDENTLVAREAARALAGITGEDFGEDADRWQEWWEKQTSTTVQPSASVITHASDGGGMWV